MGIFDVFSNSKSTATNSTQGDDTQTSTPLTDVTYPMPNTTPVTQPETDLSDQFSQFASSYDPNKDPLDIVNTAPVSPTLSEQQKITEPVEQVQPEQVQPLNNLGADFNTFQQDQIDNSGQVISEPSVQPVEQVVPMVIPTDIEQNSIPANDSKFALNQPYIDQTNQPQIQIDQGVVTPETQTTVMNDITPVEPNQVSPDQNLITNEQQISGSMLNGAGSVLDMQPTTTVNNIDSVPVTEVSPTVETPEASFNLDSALSSLSTQPTTNLSDVEVQPAEPVKLPETTANVSDTIEFGVSAPQEPVQQSAQAETPVPLTPEFKLDQPVPENTTLTTQENSSTQEIPELNNTQEQTLETSVLGSADSAENPINNKPQESAPATSQEVVLDTAASETTNPFINLDQVENKEVLPQEIADTKLNSSYESEDTSMIGKIALKNIKRLGFLGLSSKELNEGTKMDLTELSEAIGTMVEEYILDSSIGYSNDLLRGLSNKDLIIKSFVLKSAFSLFTQEPFDLKDFNNFTTYLFSDSLERVKNIIASSDALILVHSGGMNNLMEFFSAMSISTFYKDIGKPFVLLGNEWESLLSSLVSNKAIQQSEIDHILIASDSNELLSHLQKLDDNFVNQAASSDSKLRVIDLRKEDDELIYLK